MDWSIEGEMILRMFLAGICGAVVGYERKSRLKEAGIRTHFIVAMASALVMIISKYGFADVLINESIKLDPSRTAASIVTGVGFLGAGMIFIRKHTINGLTTAAGIWATAGIGMAIGAGMYIVGISGTVIILFAQVVLHRRLNFLHIPSSEQLRLVLASGDDAVGEVERVLDAHHIEIINIKIERSDSGTLTIDMLVKLPFDFAPTDLLHMFKDTACIRSVDF